MNREYYVYILATYKKGTLYVGVTNDLIRRIYEHKEKFNQDSFTARYNVHQLVYYEVFNYIDEAIMREKQLKKWNRQWKIELIENENSEWRDLADDFL